MRILCRICKKNRSSPIEIYHENPDSVKYYCFHSGELTNAEHKRELKIEDLDTEEKTPLDYLVDGEEGEFKEKKHRYKAVYRKRYRETK